MWFVAWAAAQDEFSFGVRNGLHVPADVTGSGQLAVSAQHKSSGFKAGGSATLASDGFELELEGDGWRGEELVHEHFHVLLRGTEVQVLAVLGDTELCTRDSLAELRSFGQRQGLRVDPSRLGLLLNSAHAPVAMIETAFPAFLGTLAARRPDQVTRTDHGYMVCAAPGVCGELELTDKGVPTKLSYDGDTGSFEASFAHLTTEPAPLPREPICANPVSIEEAMSGHLVAKTDATPRVRERFLVLAHSLAQAAYNPQGSHPVSAAYAEPRGPQLAALSAASVALIALVLYRRGCCGRCRLGPRPAEPLVDSASELE